jgi:hypothetical protein
MQQQSPQQQNPNVKYAPPARANDDTYRPHQFEKPQENARPAPSAPPQAPPPQAAPPQRNERDQPRTQDHGQDSKKQGDQKDKK